MSIIRFRYPDITRAVLQTDNLNERYLLSVRLKSEHTKADVEQKVEEDVLNTGGEVRCVQHDRTLLLAIRFNKKRRIKKLVKKIGVYVDEKRVFSVPSNGGPNKGHDDRLWAPVECIPDCLEWTAEALFLKEGRAPPLDEPAPKRPATAGRAAGAASRSPAGGASHIPAGGASHSAADGTSHSPAGGASHSAAGGAPHSVAGGASHCTAGGAAHGAPHSEAMVRFTTPALLPPGLRDEEEANAYRALLARLPPAVDPASYCPTSPVVARAASLVAKARREYDDALERERALNRLTTLPVHTVVPALQSVLRALADVPPDRSDELVPEAELAQLAALADDHTRARRCRGPLLLDAATSYAEVAAAQEERRQAEADKREAEEEADDAHSALHTEPHSLSDERHDVLRAKLRSARDAARDAEGRKRAAVRRASQAGQAHQPHLRELIAARRAAKRDAWVASLDPTHCRRVRRLLECGRPVHQPNRASAVDCARAVPSVDDERAALLARLDDSDAWDAWDARGAWSTAGAPSLPAERDFRALRALRDVLPHIIEVLTTMRTEEGSLRADEEARAVDDAHAAVDDAHAAVDDAHAAHELVAASAELIERDPSASAAVAAWQADAKLSGLCLDAPPRLPDDLYQRVAEDGFRREESRTWRSSPEEAVTGSFDARQFESDVDHLMLEAGWDLDHAPPQHEVADDRAHRAIRVVDGLTPLEVYALRQPFAQLRVARAHAYAAKKQHCHTRSAEHTRVGKALLAGRTGAALRAGLRSRCEAQAAESARAIDALERRTAAMEACVAALGLRALTSRAEVMTSCARKST